MAYNVFGGTLNPTLLVFIDFCCPIFVFADLQMCLCSLRVQFKYMFKCSMVICSMYVRQYVTLDDEPIYDRLQ